MTRDEAIEAIKCNWPDSRYTILREALDMAISALRQQEAVIKCNDLFDEEGEDTLLDKTVTDHHQLNEPLTLNELWQIYEASEPVYLYIFRSDIDSGWEIIEQITDKKIIFRGSMGVYVPIKELGVSYNLYRQKPKEGTV